MEFIHNNIILFRNLVLKNKKATLFLHLVTDFVFVIEILTFYFLNLHPQNLQGRTNCY